MQVSASVFPKIKRESGQVLIIILLVMIVGLTSGLLLLGRTTSDISLSTNIEESTRAFSAAEAGIEQAIRSATIGASPVPVASGLTYQVQLEDLGANAGTTIYPENKDTLTPVGETFTVWLVPHNDTTGALVENQAQAYKRNTITLCFQGSTPNIVPAPALGVGIYYKDAGNQYHTSFTGFDGDGGRVGQNSFRAATNGGPCASRGYTYSATLNMQSHFGVNMTGAGIIPLALRLRPHYGGAYVAVIPEGGAANLPKQGNKIASTGRSGETSRKIEVSEAYTQPAPFLDHALYSFGNSDLTK